jgi:hypothetical protein
MLAELRYRLVRATSVAEYEEQAEDDRNATKHEEEGNRQQGEEPCHSAS